MTRDDLPHHDPGTFVRVDGRPAVRFARTYPRSVDAVWTAVSTPEVMATWFPSSVSYEPRVGGTVRFWGDPNAGDDVDHGTVLAFEPPHVLAFTWGDNEVHLDVRESGDGAVVVLTNVLGAADEAARNAAGWDVCLANFDAAVTGDDAPARDWKAEYDRYVDAGLPHGAPVG